MKEESGRQAQLNAQMAKILKKRDKEYAQLQDELAGAQAKAVQLAVENERLNRQVFFTALLFTAIQDVADEVCAMPCVPLTTTEAACWSLRTVASLMPWQCLSHAAACDGALCGCMYRREVTPKQVHSWNASRPRMACCKRFHGSSKKR